MVSTANIIIMVVCVLVSVVAMAIPTYLIKRRSSKIETGLSGAIAYGALGYIWQYIIYMFCSMYIVSRSGLGDSRAEIALIGFFMSLVSTILTAASLYWGIFLTNQTQISIYRSAAVGIGFSLGKIGIDLLYSYGRSVYLSCQINNGTFEGRDELKASLIATTKFSLISGTYKCLLMFVIVFALALIMGHYYVSGKKKVAWIPVLVIYEIIMLLNLGLRYCFGNISGMAAELAAMAAFTVFAVAGGFVLYHWFRYDEVEWDLRKIIRKKR